MAGLSWGQRRRMVRRRGPIQNYTGTFKRRQAASAVAR